jgi:hypothetical protein
MTRREKTRVEVNGSEREDVVLTNVTEYMIWVWAERQ